MTVPFRASLRATPRSTSSVRAAAIRQRLLFGIATVPVACALILASPVGASAHVRLAPDTAAPGDYATLVFKVPTESATASTVKLEVDFPADRPFTSVSYQPTPGWMAEVSSGKLPKPVTTSTGTITQGVTKVTWTAQPGAGIPPGAFQQFFLSAGAVPDTGEIAFPAKQTYSDGTVVAWNEPTPASGKEPEHPAPILYINDAPPTAATAGGVTASAAASAAAGAAPSAAGSASATGTATGTALGLGFGIGGLGLGVIALIVAALAYVRSNRPAPGRATGRESSGS